MKNKKTKLLTVGLLALTLLMLNSVQMASGYIPGVTYLAWVSLPSDKTVDFGDSVSVTWKAKSDWYGRGYRIYKNGALVKSGSWSSYRAITYSYTTSREGTDQLKCYVYDAIRSRTDYCYITVNGPDSDGDGILDSKEISLGTNPNDPNDPLGQHFEDQSIGQNPNGWFVSEYAGYSDVSIASSSTLGLSNPKPGNLVKIVQSEWGAAPSIYDYVSYNMEDPVLISFEAGYYSQYNYELDAAYLDIHSSTAGFILKLEFEYDRVKIWETSTYCRNIDLDFNEKQMYKYDIILQNDAAGYIDYSLYINGQMSTYGTVAQYDTIGVLEFGIVASTYTEFYIDNIYQKNVDIGNTVYNLPQHQAIPLCWLYAPDVPGVQSEYHVGKTEGVEISVNLKLGFGLGDYVEVEAGIDIASWYIETYHDHYGVALSYGDSDAIVHIRYEFTISKKEIKLPGTSDVYLDVLIDCNYITSKYYDLSETAFQTTYGWIPTNPLASGIAKIGSHTKTYEQDDGDAMEYPDTEESTLLSIGGGIDVGKGLTIGAEVTYTKVIFAGTWLLVDRLLEPQFDYGRPNSYYAYLGIQPYIVRPYGTL